MCGLLSTSLTFIGRYAKDALFDSLITLVAIYLQRRVDSGIEATGFAPFLANFKASERLLNDLKRASLYVLQIFKAFSLFSKTMFSASGRNAI